MIHLFQVGFRLLLELALLHAWSRGLLSDQARQEQRAACATSRLAITAHQFDKLVVLRGAFRQRA